MLTCSECNTENVDGALYCENCGSELDEMIVSDYSAEEEYSNILESTVKLILADTGEVITLPEKDEILIGREDPVSSVFPDVDTTLFNGEDDGVSRRHARILHQGNDFLIEDLNSVNSTFLNKKKLDPELPTVLSNGDELMFGRLKFNVTIS